MVWTKVAYQMFIPVDFGTELCKVQLNTTVIQKKNFLFSTIEIILTWKPNIDDFLKK